MLNKVQNFKKKKIFFFLPRAGLVWCPIYVFGHNIIKPSFFVLNFLNIIFSYNNTIHMHICIGTYKNIILIDAKAHGYQK